MLHHSQLAVGAGSRVALKATDRLNKPALLPHLLTVIFRIHLIKK